MDIQVLGSSSKGNCYYVSDGTTSLLLDAGLPYKEIQRKLNFKMSTIAGVLVSHQHGDHSKALKDILKAGVDVYLSQATKDALDLAGHRIRVVNQGEMFSIGSWFILPFELQHDVPNLGYLLLSKNGGKLLFATDTYYIKYKFNGLTHLLIECNHSYEILNANVASGALPIEMKNRLMKSHFSLENVKKFLQANDLSKVQEIWLIHLSDGNSDAALFKKTIQAQTGKPVFIAQGG